jgi:hypothetical protein
MVGDLSVTLIWVCRGRWKDRKEGWRRNAGDAAVTATCDQFVRILECVAVLLRTGDEIHGDGDCGRLGTSFGDDLLR